MVSHEVASDFAASETDLNPVLLVRLRLLEARGDLWVKRVDLKALLHRLGALLGEDPRVGTARVENSSHFLRLAGADIQLTDVGQVLRISQRLLDLNVRKLAELDSLFKLDRITQVKGLRNLLCVSSTVRLRVNLRQEARLLLLDRNSNHAILSHIRDDSIDQLGLTANFQEVSIDLRHHVRREEVVDGDTLD